MLFAQYIILMLKYCTL